MWKVFLCFELLGFLVWGSPVAVVTRTGAEPCVWPPGCSGVCCWTCSGRRPTTCRTTAMPSASSAWPPCSSSTAPACPPSSPSEACWARPQRAASWGSSPYTTQHHGDTVLDITMDTIHHPFIHTHYDTLHTLQCTNWRQDGNTFCYNLVLEETLFSTIHGIQSLQVRARDKAYRLGVRRPTG